jgi:hypothetical protein
VRCSQKVGFAGLCSDGSVDGRGAPYKALMLSSYTRHVLVVRWDVGSCCWRLVPIVCP